MKKYIFTMLCVVLLGELRAQLITVIDKTNLQPISSVNITSSKSEQVLVTNAAGKAQIDVFKNTDSLTFSHVAYGTQSFSVAELSSTGEVTLTEKSYNMDAMVISASRFEERKQDVAQSIDIITSRDIAFSNPQTSADMMQNTGNVFVQRSQFGGGSPVIRGFETNKVLMVVDGVRMNNAIYRGGHLQNIITLDNTIMDRVEVVYGPGSVVYGSDALGGVMHFHTKDPQLSTGEGTLEKANAFVRYATANRERTGHVDFNIGGKKLASFTALTFSNYDDLMMGRIRNPFYDQFGKRDFYVKQVNGVDSAFVNENTELQVGTGYRQLDIMQKVLYQQSKAVRHILNIQYSTSSDIPRYDRLTQTSGGAPRYGEWYYGPQNRLLASYNLGVNKHTAFFDKINFIAAYQNIEESRHDRRFRNSTLNHRTEQLDIVTANLDMQKDMGKHELRYGLEGTYNKVNSTANAENIDTGEETSLDTRYPDGGSTMQSFAAFITHAWEITPKLILNDGIRASNVALHADFVDTSFYNLPFTSVDQNNTAVNGSIGLVYLPGRDWRFAFLGSSGFRAPNVDDLSKVFESVPGNVIVPNPDLEPEYTYNTEVSISKTFDKTVTVGATGYYTWYLNAITTQKGTFNNQDSITYDGQLSQVLMNVNAGEAYIYGVNAFINAEVTRNFSLYSTLNFTYGRLKTDTTDYPLDHIPPVFGKTGIVWSVKRFKADLFTMYQGWKRVSDYNQIGEDNFNSATPEGMPSWFTLNLRTSFQYNKNIQLQAAVENILDQNYRVFASGVSAPGRNFIITLRANL